MSQAPTPSYAALDYSWNALPSNGRPTSHNILYEQDPSRYETSTVSYITSSSPSIPNVAAERPSIFPGLSPLATNLPAHGGNRTLPVPMNIQSSFDSSNGSVQGTDGDAGLYQQHLETGTSQESVSSVSQDAISAAGQSSSTPSSSPSETHEMSAFPYIPMTQTSPDAPSENASGFHAMDASTTSNVGSFTSSNSASNSQLPSLNSPYNSYDGHRGTHMPERVLEPGMAIRNGNVYDPHGRPRILQPQPRRSPSYDLLKGSFEGSGKPTGKVLKPNGHGRRPDGKR